MIFAEHLTKRFGRLLAVDGVSFHVRSGRVVGFLGRNGAGKTTTIRMLTGLITPSEGRITVGGVSVTDHPLAVRRQIGYLPETTPLYPELTVLEYLRFRARLFGVPRRRRRQSIQMAISRCSLGDVRRRPIAHLSKGYRQRVGLAAAILHEPPVLVLDEPTVGLDPTQIRDVRQLIRDLAGRHTILLSTHILPEAERSCDDIIVMAGGKIRAEGSVAALRESAAKESPYVLETDSADAAAVIGTLPSIAHVESIPLSDGWYRLTVTPAAGATDRREMLSRTLSKQGAGVRELKREAASLEQMFMDLAAREPGGAPAQEAA